MIPNYRRFPVCLVRGEGSWVWDAEGNRYLDFFPGWGCNLLGPLPAAGRRGGPRPGRPADPRARTPGTWSPRARWPRRSRERSFGGQCFFCNSGAEANEAAIKLARAYGHERGPVQDRDDGRRASTAGPTPRSPRPPSPSITPASSRWSPGFAYVPLRRPRRRRRGRSTTRPPRSWSSRSRAKAGSTSRRPATSTGLRKLCDDRGVLLILDEVQTGHGPHGQVVRLPALRASTPDILTCAKALAGGDRGGRDDRQPVVAASLKPGMHASTFGGNPIACRAGAGDDRDDRAGRPARARPRHRRAVPRALRGAPRAELPDLIRDIRILGVDDRPGPDGRRLGRSSPPAWSGGC